MYKIDKSLFIRSILVLLWIQCTVRYPTVDDSNTPVLSNLIVPDILYLQSNIDYSISVYVSDPQGLNDIHTVTCLIYPLNQSVSVWEDTLQDEGVDGDIIPSDGQYLGRFTADFTGNQVGQYLVEVTASDVSLHQSNVLFDTLSAIDDRKNFPPILSSPVIPDTLTEVSL